MRISYAAFLCLCLLGAAMAAARPAHADGTVVRASDCPGYIFVSSMTGYSVLRGDAPDVKDGDILQGSVDQVGQPGLIDQRTGLSVFAHVEEPHLSRSELDQRIAIRCRARLGATQVSGYVSRTNGCGSRIFVETPEGYAILDRIAGGEVADGDTLTGNFDRPGRITVRDSQSDTSLIVFVEDLWLSRSAVDRKITQSCQSR
jgi:hypothetical protein